MTPRVQAILAKLAGKTKAQTYAHAYPYYAKLYNKSLRTITRWAAEGKPLDDPALMAEMLSPAGRKPDEPAALPTEPGPDQKPPTTPPDPENTDSPIKLDETFFASAGILAAIERLEKAEQERASAYFRAIQSRQPAAVIQNRYKEWIGIVEGLRKLALDAPEIRKANELTVDKAEMDAAVGQVFASFRTAARNLPTRAAAKLLAVRSREEFVEILDNEIELLLRTLTDLAVGALQAAEAPAPAAPEASE